MPALSPVCNKSNSITPHEFIYLAAGCQQFSFVEYGYLLPILAVFEKLTRST